MKKTVFIKIMSIILACAMLLLCMGAYGKEGKEEKNMTISESTDIQSRYVNRNI